MYWIPAILIIVELFYINYISTILSYNNVNILAKKYNSNDLERYIENKYGKIGKTSFILGIFIIFEFVYLIVGLFEPIWMVSLVFILYTVIVSVIEKLSKQKNIEKIIKLANIESDFETDNIKLTRVLKLNEIKSRKDMPNNWHYYILPVTKILAFLAIIILHYHFGLL